MLQTIISAVMMSGGGRPPEKTARQKANDKAVKKAVARIPKAAKRHQEKGLPDPIEARKEAIKNFHARDRMSPERKRRVSKKLDSIPQK
jgi:hypothetical protein